MYLRNNKPDESSVLAQVAGSIRDVNDRVDLYLDQMGEHEILNPFEQGVGAHSIAFREAVSRRFWESLGLRHIISNTSQGRLQIQEPWNIEKIDKDKFACIWDHLKNKVNIEELRTVISGSPIIGFADWARTDDASNSWEGLLSDVIKPLKKRDFEFVFQLGDTEKKLVFEVDEFLDIVGDYSCYGRVTLILDENEAGRLCSQLNGGDPDAPISDLKLNTLKDKCLFLFNTMSVGVLLILYSDRTLLITREWQFEFAGRTLKNGNMSNDTKNCFSIGYQLGLLLHFDMPHCIALGLAVLGTYIEPVSKLDSKALLAYIDDWRSKSRLKTFFET